MPIRLENGEKRMITIYAPNETDFATLGLGALAPYECVVEEQAGGMYELTMTHPMDETGKWLNIGIGCILKAPAPVRETPLAVEDDEGIIPTEPETVTRRIYRVRTNTGANLHLRQGPSTSTRILSKYRPGTEVVVLSQSGGWGQVIVRSSGASGYMSMQYLVWVRDETETIEGDAPTPQRVVYPVQSRMQLFRIFKVERDAAEREVRVEARHIFYDLLGDPTDSEYAPDGVAAGTVVEQLFDRALDPHGFDVHCQLTGSVTGDYTRRGLVECLLDPDDGVVPQTGGRLIRDNFDIWLLPDMERETGVTIRHGKNLLGATLTTDWEDLTTRIIPVGQNSDGKPLLLAGTIYVDSPRIDDYPVIRAQAVEYDVKIGQDGVNNATQARAKLTELAEADFADNGVDLPTVGLDVDFVALGETEEYKKYADLEAVHLYDTVRVIAKEAGIDAAVRVTGYKWDAIGRRYESVTLGEIADLKPTVYGYELPRGAIKTIKIAPGAVGSAQLRDLAVQYAHINTAAVEQLSANSITALKAYIHELVAESITTDQLYADIATIALAQITTANIASANIDWAQIGTLVADVAEIAKAHLGDADIDWAQIGNLTATVAEIAQVEIGEAVIDGAQITDGTITNAKIENAAIDTAKIALGAITTALIATGAVGTAQIADGSITDAKIVSLNADVINAGTLSVDRLLLKGPDGLFVAINATDEGLTAEQLSQEEYQSAISGSVLVARSVTADKIAAKSITANEIAAGAITTAELAAESVDASKIKAGSITTSHVAANFGETLDISSNKQVEIIAGDVQQAQETADSAQEGADFATPLTGAEPPEEAPAAGKLWIDEGQTPSVWRRWRGADVPTDREYEETVSGDADSPAFVSIDNAQGQLQEVELEVGCVAQQAGTGDPSPTNIRAISGRESVEVTACGRNLFEATQNTFSGSGTQHGILASDQTTSMLLEELGNDQYVFAFDLETHDLVFADDADDSRKRIGIEGYATQADGSNVYLNSWASVANGKLSANTTARIVSVWQREAGEYISTTPMYLYAQKMVSGTWSVSNVQLEFGSTATAYEPYRSMGGGTVTPSEPLYGLPGAEDTVEVSVDGDVLVTRRTAAKALDGTEDWIRGIKNDGGYYWRLSIADIYQITTSVLPNIICSHYQTETPDAQWGGTDSCISQNYNANARTEVLIYDTNYAESDLATWKAYLAAQYASGTPVTIVYELETPQAEALSAVLPITPAKGQVNLSTDADSLTATITGSGWETVNDTSGLAGDISSTQSGLEDLSDKLDAANDAIAQMASQIITPEGIVATVEASAGYQSIKTQAETAATGVSVINTKVIEVDGRIEKIEGSVRIQGSEITLGRSDSPYQNTINEEGSVITEDGQEILAIRGSKMESARVQISDAIIIGGVAIKTTSDGHVYFLRR
nr:MAG TPA: tail protein [Caudoviricetes sp.]